MRDPLTDSGLSMENERVMQAHLPGTHHDIRAASQSEPVRSPSDWSGCPESGRSACGTRPRRCDRRHHAQTAVFYSRGCQPKPDRRNVRIFQSFRNAILVPPDERSASPVLVKQPGRFEQMLGPRSCSIQFSKRGWVLRSQAQRKKRWTPSSRVTRPPMAWQVFSTSPR